MAKYLMIKTTKHPTHRAQHQLNFVLSLLLSLAITLTTHSTQADTLKDPTQPPAGLYSSTGSVGAEMAGTPALQSVMIGPHYRAAIINGKKVLLGHKYEQATLIRLNEHEAVLRSPDMSSQTLVIDYGIEKKIVSPTSLPHLLKIRPTKAK